MALGKETYGAVLMVLSGLLQTGSRTQILWLQRGQWPSYRILAVSMVSVGLLIGAYLVAIRLLGRSQCPRWQQAKWVLLRALCSSLYIILSLMAVGMGTPMGDVASLSSINSVVAALAGRAFLREPLRRAHGVGLGCSVSGALLIGLAGARSFNSGSFLGYPLAVLSGCAQAFQLIFARKSQGLPPSLLSFVAVMVVSAITVVLVAAGLVPDHQLDKVEEYPSQALFWVAVLGLVTIISTTCTCTGSMMCPAGTGATLLTGASMVSSYVAQAMLFGADVHPISLAGATLMLLSMMIMTLFRARPCPESAASARPQSTALADVPCEPADPCEPCEVVAGELDDGTDSLVSFASFVSREFATGSPHQAGSTVVQRRPGSKAGPTPHAQAVGAAVTMAL